MKQLFLYIFYKGIQTMLLELYSLFPRKVHSQYVSKAHGEGGPPINVHIVPFITFYVLCGQLY